MIYQTTTNCCHIKSSGARCGAPAMRRSTLCYFHSDLNRRHEPFQLTAQTTDVPKALLNEYGQFRDPLTADYYSGSNKPFRLAFPALEDPESIQIALSVILTAFANNRLDPKRTSILLYGLQVASTNATRIKPTSPAQIVVEVTEQPNGTVLAAPDPQLQPSPIPQ